MYEWRPPAWQARANCLPSRIPDVWQPLVRHPVDLFFPQRMGDKEVPWRAAIAAVCGTCPVKGKCLEHGIQHEERGWWGGVSPRRLAQLRRERQVSRTTPEVDPVTQKVLGTFIPASHGTVERFRQHKVAGETPCMACKEARRLFYAEQAHEKYVAWKATASEEEKAAKRADSRQRSARRHRGEEWPT